VGHAIRAAVEAGGVDAVLLDCLTLLVSNVILEYPAEQDPDKIDEAAAQARVTAELEALFKVFRAGDLPWIVVSNQVGSGLVPHYRLGRVYRDLLGWTNH
jgi:adenosylcobinamide kinase/adenosylcobinamide-phosphate guanylyltransferase